MSYLSFALSVFALLILPGPTNAVLAMASQGISFTRAVVLVVAVVLSYLTVVLPVAGLAGTFLKVHPAVSEAVKLISATWVLYLALKLWVVDARASVLVIGVRHVVVTTLLNPKALIIALTMIAPDQDRLPIAAVGSFSAVAVLTSTIWLLVGRTVLGSSNQMPLIARRFGSGVLLVFSAILTVSALQQ
ncbi:MULTISPECIES: threonine transporter RhtB [Rhizobium]|nr:MULTISPECIES: threonine transporter RhtB [Rhizobium]MCS0463244.1 threonine transporter RhtB [Rhizobium favelukesii]UFS79750.1 threonine transporter RhtB [Rhizobium sp. T136]